MTETSGTARQAAEQNAKAVMEGNIAAVIGQLTPEAMAQMMQLGNQGSLTPQQMPAITGYEIQEAGSDGDSESFDVTFHSQAGSATLRGRWKRVMDQWKIAEVTLISAEAAGDGSA